MAACLREKAMGLAGGASDLLLVKKTALYGGYFIELKAPGKKPTPLQIHFMARARDEGYKAEWFDDWVKAKESIEDYLLNR